MGSCSSSENANHLEAHSVLDTKSKRYSTLSFTAKGEFSLKLLPYSEMEEKLQTIHIEIPIYNSKTIPPYEWRLEDVAIGSDLGLDDHSSLIFKAYEKTTRCYYSLQVIPFDQYDDYKFKDVLYTTYVHQDVSSTNFPNIVKLLDVYIIDPGRSKQKYLIYILDLCEANLSEIINYRKTTNWHWTEQELLFIMRDLGRAMDYLESKGVVHRDLRPENIWFSCTDNSFKIGGLTSSKKLPEQHKLNTIQEDFMLHTVRGRPLYLAPEITKVLASNPTESVCSYNAILNDAYGLGMTFLAMKNLEVFPSEENISNSQNVVNYESKLTTEIICKLMHKNPKRRLLYHHFPELIKDPKLIPPNERNIVDSLIHHEKANISVAKSLQIKEYIADTYLRLFQVNDAIDQYTELCEFFELHNDEENKAQTFVSLADLYEQRGDNFKATEYYLKSSEIFNRLGNEYRKNGEYDKSVQSYEKALKIGINVYDEDTVEMAFIKENIGNVYRLLGEFEKAKKYQEEALAKLVAAKGKESVEVAKLLNNLGNVYAGLGDYSKAEKKFTDAIYIIKTFHKNKKQHLLALSLCNLGEVFRFQGKLLEARQSLEEALVIKENYYGAGHLEVASTTDNLGNVYYDMGEFNQAKEMYEEALMLKEKKLGPEHPDIGLSLNNLGNVFRSLNDFETARFYYEKALNIYKKSYGELHPNYAAALGNLGLNLKDKGDFRNAEVYLRNALGIIQAKYGEKHPDFLFFHEHLQTIMKNFNA